MKIRENGVIREMTAEEIVDYQTALECQKTLEFLRRSETTQNENKSV